jgi:hypothetical protein
MLEIRADFNQSERLPTQKANVLYRRIYPNPTGGKRPARPTPGRPVK